MSPRVLNSIIIFSLAGIILISVRDFIWPQNIEDKSYTNTAVTPSPITSSSNSNDPEVPCYNKYLPLSEGTAWTYRLTTATDKKTASRLLTSQVTLVATSSAIIRTDFADTKESATSTITCHKSGLYGLPFPLFTPDKAGANGNITELLSLVNIPGNILLLPSDETIDKGSWNSSIMPHLKIPIPLNVQLESKVVSREKKIIESVGVVDVLNIEAGASANDNTLKQLPFDTSKIIKYQIADGVGVVSFDLNIPLSKTEGVKTSIRLVKFGK